MNLSPPFSKINWKDYDPFGMLMVGRSWSVGSEYRYGFNRKEVDNEVAGDGNEYDYGFRVYNPRLGKFLSVDPLTTSYSMLSPYQFASNSPIFAIDLDGLEAKVAIAGNGGEGTLYSQQPEDAVAFNNRAQNLAINYGFISYQVSTGDEFIKRLEDATSIEGSIQSVVIFSHGIEEAIVLNWNAGFYTTDNSYSTSSGSATVADLKSKMNSGDIKFLAGSTIIFGSCKADASSADRNIAEDITITTGVTTIAATSLVQPEIVNGKETGRLTTLGSFVKNDLVYDLTYTVGDKSITRPFSNKEEANIYSGIIKENGATIISLQSRLQSTNLRNAIDPSEY